MAKYVIDIDTENPFTDKHGARVYSSDVGVLFGQGILYDLEPLTAEYINEHFGELQEQAYKQGVNDERMAHGSGNHCASCVYEGNSEHEKPCSECSYNHTSQYVRRIKQDQIKVGDEIESNFSKARGTAIVTKVTDINVHYWYSDGTPGYNPRECVKKTGRHFPEVAELLNKMKGGDA